MSENPLSEKDMRCYEGDAEEVYKIAKKGDRDVLIMFSFIALVSFSLYLVFPSQPFFSGLFLFIGAFNILFILMSIVVPVLRDRDGNKFSYVNKICFDNRGMKVQFPSQSLYIPFENILYIYFPKNRAGEIAYIIENGKRKYKELWLTEDLFYIIKDEIINYFKAKGGRPPFLVVMPEERAAMRNTVVWLQTYAVENKKEKMDRILEKFWSKHTLEEFE